MLFIVQFDDVYAEQPERLPKCAQHMAFLASHGDQVVAAGALRSSSDGVPTGGIWIINAESKAAVKAFYQGDPFWKAALRKPVRVSHWAKAHWSAAFTDCVIALG